MFPAPFRDEDPDWRGESRLAWLVPCLFRDGEGNLFAGEKFSMNFDSEEFLFGASPDFRYAGDGVSNEDSIPDEPVSMDLARLSLDDCEDLRRNTTGLLADGADT